MCVLMVSVPGSPRQLCAKACDSWQCPPTPASSSVPYRTHCGASSGLTEEHDTLPEVSDTTKQTKQRCVLWHVSAQSSTKVKTAPATERRWPSAHLVSVVLQHCSSAGCPPHTPGERQCARRLCVPQATSRHVLSRPGRRGPGSALLQLCADQGGPRPW